MRAPLALSFRRIEDFLEDVGSALHADARKLDLQTLGRQMNVIGGTSERPLPRNVGLRFFNDGPQHFFPATQIDAVWFPDGPGGDHFEEKSFKGPLGRMTRDALEYIERQFLKESVLKRPDRAEASRFWNYPFAAIEEAVVNAVYHRSYEIREPVEVRITPQELVVLSFPGPDRSIRMENLRAGKAVSRRYCNRRIGEFLQELDLAEGRATGIPKILRVMDHELSKPQIAKLLGLKPTGHFRKTYLEHAVDKGFIERTVPMNPTSPHQKYRLTPKGLALKRRLNEKKD